jgi:hypothetical protein
MHRLPPWAVPVPPAAATRAVPIVAGSRPATSSPGEEVMPMRKHSAAATTMTAIALAESSGNTGARNSSGEDSRGL